MNDTASPFASWHMGIMSTRLEEICSNLPGIDKPYLYFAVKDSLFPFHIEDVLVSSKQTNKSKYLEQRDQRYLCCIFSTRLKPNISLTFSVSAFFPQPTTLWRGKGLVSVTNCFPVIYIYTFRHSKRLKFANANGLRI